MLSGLLSRFGGFSLIGVINTLLSMLLLFVLNELCNVDYRISYTLSYVFTVLLAYVANAYLVFHAPVSFFGAVGFFASYLSGMVFGMALLWCGKHVLPSVNVTLLSYFVIPFTMVWNFFFVNILFSKGDKKEGGA